MRSAANNYVKMLKVSRGVQVYGDRDLITQNPSPNQPIYIDVAQERSQVFWT